MGPYVIKNTASPTFPTEMHHGGAKTRNRCKKVLSQHLLSNVLPLSPSSSLSSLHFLSFLVYTLELHAPSFIIDRVRWKVSKFYVKIKQVGRAPCVTEAIEQAMFPNLKTQKEKLNLQNKRWTTILDCLPKLATRSVN
jgi:hypothetical protein